MARLPSARQRGQAQGGPVTRSGMRTPQGRGCRGPRRRPATRLRGPPAVGVRASSTLVSCSQAGPSCDRGVGTGGRVRRLPTARNKPELGTDQRRQTSSLWLGAELREVGLGVQACTPVHAHCANVCTCRYTVYIYMFLCTCRSVHLCACVYTHAGVCARASVPSCVRCVHTCGHINTPRPRARHSSHALARPRPCTGGRCSQGL